MAKRRRRKFTAKQLANQRRFAAMARRKAKGRKRTTRRRRRSSSPRRFTIAAPFTLAGRPRRRRRRSGGSFMARRRRSYRRKGSRRFSGLSGRLGGVLSKEVLATVAGASAVGFVGPMVSKYLPAKWGQSSLGRIGSAATVGALGFLILKRYNRAAALGFMAAAVAPTIANEISAKTAGTNGFGEPDGQDYLPEDVAGYLGEGDDMMGDVDEYAGVGDYDPAFAEV